MATFQKKLSYMATFKKKLKARNVFYNNNDLVRVYKLKAEFSSSVHSTI